MSEWQPARFRPFHTGVVGLEDYITLEEYHLLKGRMLRIRPSKHVFSPSDRAEIGCYAEKFYEIHPEDVIDGCGNLICEHEILTD